jgi:hypothetical protein
MRRVVDGDLQVACDQEAQAVAGVVDRCEARRDVGDQAVSRTPSAPRRTDHACSGNRRYSVPSTQSARVAIFGHRSLFERLLEKHLVAAAGSRRGEPTSTLGDDTHGFY